MIIWKKNANNQNTLFLQSRIQSPLYCTCVKHLPRKFKKSIQSIISEVQILPYQRSRSSILTLKCQKREKCVFALQLKCLTLTIMLPYYEILSLPVVLTLKVKIQVLEIEIYLQKLRKSWYITKRLKMK